MPSPYVVAATYLGEFRVFLQFHDGVEGVVDLRDEIWGTVFEPLRDPDYFAAFVVDSTLIWPNGADFAPEFLYERVKSGKDAAMG